MPPTECCWARPTRTGLPFQTEAYNETARLANQPQQFAAGYRYNFAVANFTEQRSIRLFLQAPENPFEKRHETSTPLCASSNSLSAGLRGGRYSSQPERAGAHGELGIAPPHLLLKINAHPRHQLEVPGDGAAHGVANLVGAIVQRSKSSNDFVLQFRFVDLINRYS